MEKGFNCCTAMMVKTVSCIYSPSACTSSFAYSQLHTLSFQPEAMTDTSSWTGSSWRLIGAITRLSERKMLRSETPPIVVMIPSGEGGILPGMNMPGMNRRHAEYGDMGTVISEAHGEFVAKTLHPYVMERFRTKDGPEHTATIGSSLGGQSSLQLVLRHPEIFGGAACLSPCFQAGTIASVVANLVGNSDTSSTRYNKQDDANHRSLRSKTIYLDNGGDVDETRVPVFDAMDHFTMNERWWNPGYFWLGEFEVCMLYSRQVFRLSF